MGTHGRKRYGKPAVGKTDVGASTKHAALVQSGQDEKRVVRKFCLEYSGSVLKADAFLRAIVALAAELEKA